MGHLGELINDYQDRHGSSQNFIAEKIGVSSTLVGRWKRGDFQELPKPEILEALAEQLGVTLKVVVDAALADTYYDETKRAARQNPERPRRGPREQKGD